jgi:transcriptional regulator with XRE-family HTH domain
MPTDFPEILKELRLEAGYGLREFAEMIGDAPSNYAGVESGMRAPWRNQEKLRRVADSLGLEEGSSKWDRFFIAAQRTGMLPPDVQHVLDRPGVALVLRTVDERQLNEEELRKVVQYIRRNFRNRTHDSGRTR